MALAADSKVKFRVLSAHDFDPSIRGSKRKIYRKTKSGCLTCKAKKVKVGTPISRSVEVSGLTNHVSIKVRRGKAGVRQVPAKPQGMCV